MATIDTTTPASEGMPVPAPRRGSWVEGPSGFPKASEIIQCLDSDLRGSDRKLLNVILARSQDKLTQDPDRVFFAHCADLRREIGWGGHKYNQEIADSLLRLQKTVVTIGYKSGGKWRSSRLSLLIQTDVPRQEGIVYWKWNPAIAGLVGDPKHFAYIFLRVVAGLRGEAAPRLYENLAIHAQADGSVEYELMTLRELLAAGHQSVYGRWHEFKRRVLDPALQEVNRLAPFHVEMTPQRGEREKVVGVRFVMRPKSDWEAASIEFATPEDGGARKRRISPARIRKLADRLSARSRRRFAELFEGVDLDEAAMIWAEDTLARDRDVKRPSVAFESWMRAVHPILREGCTKPDILWAASTLARMNNKVRNAWIEIARRKEGVEVPDASQEHIHVWVHAVLEELKSEEGYDADAHGLGEIAIMEANQTEMEF